MQLPSIERTSGIKPQFTWDNTQYVLGRVSDTGKKAARSLEAFEDFKKFHCERLSCCNSPSVQAFLAYLGRWQPADAEKLPLWEDLVDQNIVFRLVGSPAFLHDDDDVNRIWQQTAGDAGSKDEHIGMCLVSGQTARIAKLHPFVKGVDGGNAKGGSLVSFNATAFTSYGLEDGANGAVGV